MSTTNGFYQLRLPSGRVAYLPDDVTVKLPDTDEVTAERLHLLAYIPWDDKYFSYVPEAHLDFFRYVVPHLNARTTDVHTALSVSYVPELVAAATGPVDESVLYPAVILHDCGWPRLSPAQIADSLDYSSLAYSEQALEPKRLHATLGAEYAKKLLQEYPGDLGLTDTQKEYISTLVHYHDQIISWPAEKGTEPMEYLLLGDADRLWSYTHENFWLDTIRKNVPPQDYIENIAKALEDGFFLTPQGKAIAARLVAERRKEVAACPV